MDRYLKKLEKAVDAKIKADNAANQFAPDPANKPKGKAATGGYLCVDGEAIDGKYCYLAASNGRSVEHLSGLKTRQVFGFLLGLGVRELWGFWVSYDVNMWLCDLKEADLKRLADTGMCFWCEYKIEHIPGKEFRLFEREKNKKGEWENRRTIRLWDLWNFADCKFVELVERWRLATPAESDWLQEMKEERPIFTKEYYPAIKLYCNTELQLLHRAVEHLKELVQAEGIKPQTWHSPGSIAAVVMRTNGIQNHLGRDDIPETVKELARYAYYGGRAEVAAVGLIQGPLYAYDIHSAYPAAAVGLPSLTGGTWEHVEGAECVDLGDPCLFALVRCQWTPKKSGKKLADRPDWGPFPWRIGQNSSSQYPLASDDYCYRWEQYGWYWSCEIAAARFISNITLLEAWIFHPANNTKPFAYLQELYNRRLELKAQNDDREHVMKMILNATLGKLGQKPNREVESGVGGKEVTDPERKLPAFHSLVYAGWITAKTRSLILWELARGNVVIVATDSITTTSPRRLPLGDGLGQWELEVRPWMFIVQAGFYYWPDASGVVHKSRGIGKSNVPFERILEHWQANGKDALIFPQRIFCGYKSALGANNLDKWRTWIDVDKSISLTMEPRRIDLPRTGDIMRSKPPLIGDRQRGLFEEILSNGNTHKDLDLLSYEQPDIE